MKLCKQKVDKVDTRVDKLIEEMDNVVTGQTKHIEASKDQCEGNMDIINQIMAKHQEQMRQMQKKIEETRADKITYVYRNVEDLPKRSKFYGEGNENPIEFLIECERSMDHVGNNLSESERIEWVTNRFEKTAAQWFQIIRETITTYADFKRKFEERYWNHTIQRKIRDRLEFGRYDPRFKTKEAYVIELVARAKHLRPQLTEGDMVIKLSYHFNRDISVAVITRGIQTIEQFLLMLAQWEEARYTMGQVPRDTEQHNPGTSRDAEPSSKNKQQSSSYQKKSYYGPGKKMQVMKCAETTVGVNQSSKTSVEQIASTSSKNELGSGGGVTMK